MILLTDCAVTVATKRVKTTSLSFILTCKVAKAKVVWSEER